MSKINDNITKEKQELLNKAESYFEEFEEATEDLEESAEKLGRNLLVVASIGLGLALMYKYFSGDDGENKKSETGNKTNYEKPSRFGSALKTIAVPFLLGIAKNVVFPDMNFSKKENDGGNP